MVERILDKNNSTKNGSKIKVLFVSPFSWLYGGELCLLEIATGLNREIFEPTVVATGEGPLTEKLRAANVSVQLLEMPYMTQRGKAAFDFVTGVLPASMRLAKIIKQGQFDLVYNNILQNPYGAIAAKLAGVPCLWHIHEVGNNKILRQSIAKIVTMLATRIVVVSKAVGDIFSAQAQSKMDLVYNGVDPELYNPKLFDSMAARRKFSDQPDQPLIGIVARLHPSKRHSDLFQAMPKIIESWPGCQLLVVGNDTVENEMRLKSLTKDLNIEKNVKFLGYMSDVREVLSAIDVLVLPSHHEAFPRVPLEAMAMGKPVVATAVGGIPEEVNHNSGRLVGVGEPTSLAKEILYVLNDKERRLQMGFNGRKRVLSTFTLDDYVNNLQNIMLEMVTDVKQPHLGPVPDLS